ncbi:MAG: tRNA 4-thiouridine(8) synthase ThiI [bacterium]|nr:tRNA 4-thiouridine(8) synthase ThiI [bacterium]
MRALALYSGGLDSVLAIKIIMSHGIEVIPIGFVTPFYSPDVDYGNKILGVPVISIDITEEFIDILLSPSHGYGKNMNPCIDCHALMIKKARNLLGEYNAKFIITGEVLGERPMSQNRWALKEVEKSAGAEGLVVRPLSGALLPPTIPEEMGWIKREWLFDISGRKRNRQIELARLLGIEEYKTPAGGCLLTDTQFSKRLKFLIGIKGRPSREELELLRIGRHFYTDNCWFVIGRNERENKLLKSSRIWRYMFFTIDYPGPTGIIVEGELIDTAIRTLIRYSDAPRNMPVKVKILRNSGESYITESVSLSEEEIEKIRV